MLTKIKNRISMAAVAAPIYAAEEIVIGPDGGQWDPLTNLTAQGIVSGAINLILIVVALVFFFILVFGGLRWVTSGGDEKKVGDARAQITNALIGLAIVFAAWAIMKLIGTAFGIDILGGIEIPTFQ
jgi:type IV secretion system pilin